MKLQLYRFFYFVALFNTSVLFSQFEFTGYIDNEKWSGDIYLSLIEDYRKLSGIYPEQIIQKTHSDSLGYFSFSGNNLPSENRIYRIHIENCSGNKEHLVHFDGFCPDSEEVIFVANNTDSISLPFSLDKEVFCTIVSTNEKSNAFISVDSIIDEMRYAFASYRSETNRKLNTNKWFSTLQNFTQGQNEPLSELYLYSFLSNKSSNLYSYYLDDLKRNTYYDELLKRLEKTYPGSIYLNQYKSELASDKFLTDPLQSETKNYWLWLIVVLLLISVCFNIFQFLGSRKEDNSSNYLRKELTQQEQKVLEFILNDKTNKEIASSMFVSVSTIKTHINNLYKKLKVSSRDEVKALFTNK
ncbi:LuxR C-terminal-related transcriptional regulator [Aquimarina sp. D1M17]|uniref:response regulator transcription factor n=1 Tax=Aquimarina acroporae TaxID=2937283 RepID=UPI0020BD78C0|nr:LuxR C-terminal-related transcriptional regulator [Aquimarina acroporae]MCK8521574.1 LuxR C-terminal-related transcriptional regulator [Aquimarina acroporae]